MPSQPAGSPTSSPQRGNRARAVGPEFTDAEWQLLVRLPGQVVIAATSAEPDAPRRTVSEGLAGIDAIAAGRASDSDFVRDVVRAIYVEGEDSGPVDSEPPTAEEFLDRSAGLAEVLTTCRAAAAVLARADPADSAAYRQWLQSIAARVCGAARSGGLLGLGGARLSAAERAFLADLGAALGLG